MELFLFELLTSEKKKTNHLHLLPASSLNNSNIIKRFQKSPEFCKQIRWASNFRATNKKEGMPAPFFNPVLEDVTKLFQFIKEAVGNKHPVRFSVYGKEIGQYTNL